MEETPHGMMVRKGAYNSAMEQGFEEKKPDNT